MMSGVEPVIIWSGTLYLREVVAQWLRRKQTYVMQRRQRYNGEPVLSMITLVSLLMVQ